MNQWRRVLYDYIAGGAQDTLEGHRAQIFGQEVATPLYLPSDVICQVVLRYEVRSLHLLVCERVVLRVGIIVRVESSIHVVKEVIGLNGWLFHSEVTEYFI